MDLTQNLIPFSTERTFLVKFKRLFIGPYLSTKFTEVEGSQIVCFLNGWGLYYQLQKSVPLRDYKDEKHVVVIRIRMYLNFDKINSYIEL